MTKETGGPAFPINIDSEMTCLGITARDYFAAKAMPIIYDQWLKNNWNLFEHPEACEALSNEAYLIADAMLEARNA
jgi:hypothetical protein